jgi:hypothetical protein
MRRFELVRRLPLFFPMLTTGVLDGFPARERSFDCQKIFMFVAIGMLL